MNALFYDSFNQTETLLMQLKAEVLNLQFLSCHVFDIEKLLFGVKESLILIIV